MLRSTTCQKLYQVRLLSTRAFNAQEAASKLQLTFKTPGILEQALTHRSFQHGNVASNDRLQMLGRSVLRLNATVAGTKALGANASRAEIRDYVYQHADNDALASRFEALGLKDGLRFTSVGSSQDAPNGIKAKAFEAVVGAICHDQGLQAAEAFVNTHLYD
ncbi:ribonuclease-III-like-domain-containing protein [Gongronella butleri]|nr:ribonuclease-III-like-domain-containing protein [Gongronella butleri]